MNNLPKQNERKVNIKPSLVVEKVNASKKRGEVMKELKEVYNLD